MAAAEEDDATEGQDGTGWGHSSSLPRGVVTGSMSGRNPFARNRASNSSSRGTSAQRPRAPLLALRSGLHQPARCRGESLDRLGHLSVDGMMRPWLPTYSSLGAKAQQQAHEQGAGMQLVAGRRAAAAREQCYLQGENVRDRAKDCSPPEVVLLNWGDRNLGCGCVGPSCMAPADSVSGRE